MKILLTGGTGQVGFELRRSLSVLGDVVAVGAKECDLRDAESIRHVVIKHSPDVIVNAAAYTAVDKAESEKDLAEAVNAIAPGILADEAERLDALVVHFSTDYVFDGIKSAPYIEEDHPNPLSVYGATKLAGERAVQARCSQHIVLRTSWVVGAHGSNFAKTMLRLALEQDVLRVVNDQFGAPTSAALLADLTAHLVSRATQTSDEFKYGLYHAVASGVTNWYEYACYVIARAREAGKSLRVRTDAVQAIRATEFNTVAARPANSQLDTGKLRRTFGLHLPSWQAGVDHVLEQIL